MPQQSKCRLCDQPVVWCRSGLTGSLFLLEERANGQTVIIEGRAYSIANLAEHGQDKALNASQTRYGAHFDGCPEMQKLRKLREEDKDED